MALLDCCAKCLRNDPHFVPLEGKVRGVFVSTSCKQGRLLLHLAEAVHFKGLLLLETLFFPLKRRDKGAPLQATIVLGIHQQNFDLYVCHICALPCTHT